MHPIAQFKLRLAEQLRIPFASQQLSHPPQLLIGNLAQQLVNPLLLLIQIQPVKMNTLHDTLPELAENRWSRPTTFYH
jgi:hypothetical protein